MNLKSLQPKWNKWKSKKLKVPWIQPYIVLTKFQIHIFYKQSHTFSLRFSHFGYANPKKLGRKSFHSLLQSGWQMAEPIDGAVCMRARFHFLPIIAAKRMLWNGNFVKTKNDSALTGRLVENMNFKCCIQKTITM